VSSRPPALVAGIVLFVLLSVANLASFAMPGGEDGIPIEVLYLGVALGIVGLGAAYGLWQGNRWALAVAVVVLLLSGMSAAPGLFFAPSTALQLAATAGVVLSIVNLILLLVPGSRRFFTA
jgi:hypothetical protein